MPSLRKTSSNDPLYLLVTHAPVGFAVHPASQTRRLSCAMKKNAY
jgi:hypothetical protein